MTVSRGIKIEPPLGDVVVFETLPTLPLLLLLLLSLLPLSSLAGGAVWTGAPLLLVCVLVVAIPRRLSPVGMVESNVRRS